MSRTCRHDRLSPVRKTPVVFSPGEVLAKLKREIKRMMVKDGHIVDPATRPPRFEWQWRAPFGMMLAEDGTVSVVSGVVYADTRSQAKAAIKKELGITKGRLPASVQFHGVPNANQS